MLSQLSVRPDGSRFGHGYLPFEPKPVRVLDEVDAALDEANVARFCKTIQSCRPQPVCRHYPPKLTMRSCQRLYGVTMQERGVSKLVGVRVDDIEETKQGDVALLNRAGINRNRCDPQFRFLTA